MKIDAIKITPDSAREALYRLDGPIASEEGMIIENALTAWEEEREELERMKKAKAVTDVSWRELMEEIRKLREERDAYSAWVDALQSNMRSAQQEIERLEKDIADRDKAIAEAMIEIRELSRRLADLEAEARIEQNYRIEVEGKLNQALEALERIAVVDVFDWGDETFQGCVNIARQAIQQIRGEDKHVETTPN